MSPKKPSMAKVQANRANSKKSTGPTNTISTRFNSVKHGLLAECITELDDSDYKDLQTKVQLACKPEGPIECFLADRICLCMIRLRRACRLEAEFITGELNPPITEKGPLDFSNFYDMAEQPIVIDPGIPAKFPSKAFDSLIGNFQRYETAIENKLYRTINQLERMQRMRMEEKLTAPVSPEIADHLDKQALASFGNPTEGSNGNNERSNLLPSFD